MSQKHLKRETLFSLVPLLHQARRCPPNVRDDSAFHPEHSLRLVLRIFRVLPHRPRRHPPPLAYPHNVSLLFCCCFFVAFSTRLKAGADPNIMDETGAKPGDVFHDGVSMSQRFEIKKLLRQRYNLMGESSARAIYSNDRDGVTRRDVND